MKRPVALALALAAGLCLPGCWDQVELNDRAIVVGSGLDWRERAPSVTLTEQIVLPQGIRSESTLAQNSVTLSASGDSVQDAMEKIQSYLSRKTFISHRRVFFIGETMAQHGILSVLDEMSRNRDVRLRSDAFVVRRASAADVLRLHSPLEKIPSLGVVRSRHLLGATTGTSFLDFLIAASDETGCPTLPMVEVRPSGLMVGRHKEDILRFTGRAIFDKNLKCIDYLTVNEATYRLWVLGALGSRPLTVPLPKNYGKITVDVRKFRSTVKVHWTTGAPRFDIRLSMIGSVMENPNALDLKKQAMVKKVEQAMGAAIAQRTWKMIHRVQRKDRADIFQFGNDVFRRYPRRWNAVKKDWPTLFPAARVTVRCKTILLTTGATGRSLHLKPSQFDESGW